ncbi:MAG: GDP-mannose 4,6-dehydratase, partial [Chloroflexi bacterium]|nr:GDP-mannose 4,6-dehydratase [Chloroflexota bacterium]
AVHPHEVHGLTRGSAPPGYEQIHHADLLSAPAVRSALEAARPDAVIHLAAQSAVPQSWQDPTGTLVNNIAGQANLFETIRQLGLPARIVVAISAEVYGNVPPAHLPVREEEAFRPLNPYAVSKAAQDLLAFQYATAFGMDIIRLRTFNHLGPGQSDRFALPSFAHQIAEIELGRREPVLSTGDLTTERDYTDVRDIAHAYLCAIEAATPSAAYNVGSGVAYRIADLLEQMCALARTPIAIRPDPRRFRPADIPRIVSDSSRFRNATGWEPRITIAQSLADVLEDWRYRVRIEHPPALLS